MPRYYFYCEKYINDGFWDCLEHGTDKFDLIMNYTSNGIPGDDVEEFEVMEFVGSDDDIDMFYEKVLDILDERNLEKLRADPKKSKGMLQSEVYIRMMEKLGYTREEINKIMDEEEELFLEWLLDR